MAVSLVQEAFTGGEWSPSLHSRSTHAKYGTACAKMLNFYPHPHGGASNRTGFEYQAEIKDSTKTARLKRFQFNTAQGYILEFGNLYIRFYYQGGGQIVSAKAITGATNATPINITAVAHGFATGNTVTVAGVGGNTAANGTWVITVTGVDNFTLNTSVGNGVYTTGGTATAIVEVASPYLEADLPLLNFEQSNDVLYIAHRSYAPRTLTRTSHTAWTLATATFGSTVAAPASPTIGGTGKTFGVTAVTDAGLESVPAEDDGDYGNTFSWSAVSGATEYKVYVKVDGIYQFIARTSNTSYAVAASPTLDPDISAPQAKTPFGSTNNYPGAVGFWKQRLGWASTNNNPQKFWLSATADFLNLNFSSPIQDDDSINRTLNSSQVNEIRWITELRFLAMGTAGGEWRVFSGTDATSVNVTPSSIDAERDSDWGVAAIQPLLIGKSLLFIDASGKIVRDLNATVNTSGENEYDGNDLSILAAHLFRDYGMTYWCYETGPDSRVWAVREDGYLLGMTFLKEHRIDGWHRHNSEGTFESVESIRKSDGGSEVWAIVNRTINSATVRYVERRHERDFIDIEDAFFVDAGLTYDGSVAATLTPGAGALTVGTEDVVFTAGSSVFVVGDVDRYIYYRYQDGEDAYGNPIFRSAKAQITTYTSGTSVKATINLAFPSLAAIASGDWRMTVTSLSGLDHLEGETVVCLADGSVQADLVVASGAVTLEEPASLIHIGLGYTCDLWTLGFVYPTRTGTVQDRIRSISSAVVTLANTRACHIGPDEDHLLELQFRTDENYGEPTRLFNGDKEKTLKPATNPREGRIFIRVTEPLPCTVQAIYPRESHGER